MKNEKNSTDLFFQPVIPWETMGCFKGSKKGNSQAFAASTYTYTRIFYTEPCFACEVLVANKKKERERFKPAVLEEPPDLNANTILNIPPERVQIVWGNCQEHLL